MGKDNKEKFRASPFDFMSGGRVRKMGDELGIDSSEYNINNGRNDGGQGRTYKGDRDDYMNAVLQAKANHYDTRRTLEAAALSGKGKANKIIDSGFKDFGDAMNAQNFLEKAAKRHGQGGDFSSISDHMGLTQSMVERDRRKQTEAYDKSYAKTTDLNDLKDKLMAEATAKAPNSDPIEPSDRMAGVESRLEGAASNTPPSLYSKNNTDPAKADDQKDAARNFLGDYKLDVVKGAGIKQDIATGLGNAAAHVSNIYGR